MPQQKGTGEAVSPPPHLTPYAVGLGHEEVLSAGADQQTLHPVSGACSSCVTTVQYTEGRALKEEELVCL